MPKEADCKDMSNPKQKIKILVVTHKPAKFPKGECFVPIHAGRAVAMEESKDGRISRADLEWLKNNTIGDNTGENISIKNRYYNELSALYWAWKNYDKLGKPDYIGLMHYRRHFVFNEQYWKNKFKKQKPFKQGLSIIREKFFDKEYTKRIALNEVEIQNICNDNDVILSYPTKLSYAYNKELNIRSDYANISGLNVSDFDLMINVIKNKYPNSANELDKFIAGDSKYIYQMFIMKKELFFEYCEFLFSILFEIEKQINFDNYTIKGKRTLGYLGEIMLSIFFIINKHKDLKIKNLGITFIKYDSKKDFLISKTDSIIKNLINYRNKLLFWNL